MPSQNMKVNPIKTGLVAAVCPSHICCKGQGRRLESGTVSKGKYSVELFKEGTGSPGQEEIVDRHDNLTVARAIYRGRVSQYPGRLVRLRHRARVLARSDQPETMP
jgi:hypothetical protein